MKKRSSKPTQSQMRIEYVPLEEVRRWPRNPKAHDLEAIDGSISRFGYVQPILVDEKTGLLVAGHGRLETLVKMRDAGEGPPKRIVVEGGVWKVPVVRGVSFKSKSEAEAYLIADNRLVELGGWDNAQLLELLKDQVNVAGADSLPSIGFDEELLESLIAEVEGSAPASPPSSSDEGADDYDAIPDPPPKPRSKPGRVYRAGRHRIHCKDCLEMLRDIRDGSADSIVTDPPYGIGFMGKEWDVSVPGSEFAKEAFRVLKPGGHVIAFAATRTIHRLVVNLEDAGFEVRDMISWLQWQGFPKSLDVSKGIDELKGAVREVVGHKDSGLDKGSGNSVSFQGASGRAENGLIPVTAPTTEEAIRWDGWGTGLKPAQEPAILVRKPFKGTVVENVLKHGTGALNLGECRYQQGDKAWPGPQDGPGGWGGGAGFSNPQHKWGVGSAGNARPQDGRWAANIYYCPKPSVAEKDQGGVSNFHATVKPVALMRWLVRLVTPPAGVVVEPFAGSGSTIVAAHLEGLTCIASERDPLSCDVSVARVKSFL